MTMTKAILTCALNGVLTDPRQHPVPVTPAEMAAEARRAYDAGASIMHIHLRRQGEGKGHLPSWDVALSREVQAAIRAACPGVVINHTSGVVGPDIEPALACIRETKPEIAACNAGSLNYLKLKADGSWAWPPMLFDNEVNKVSAYLAVMRESGTKPEFECFDTGIVRSVEMYRLNGMTAEDPQVNFVMGVASGMAADPDLLPLLLKWKPEKSPWQVTAIGREEIWALHQKAADLGGHLRVGLEDTFYRPTGEKASSNGALVEDLAACARRAGREVASVEETRAMLGL